MNNTTNTTKCPFKCPTEHTPKMDDQFKSFKEFMTTKQNKPKPILKKNIANIQLHNLLSPPEDTSVIIKQQTVHHTAQHITSKMWSYRSNENSPIKPQTILPVLVKEGRDTQHSSARDLSPAGLDSFKFNSPTRRKPINVGMRNCQQQLQKLGQHKKTYTLPMKQTMSQQQIINRYFETKFTQLTTAVQRPLSMTERIDQEAEVVFNKLISDKLLKSKYVGRNLKHLKEIYRSLLAVGYDREILLDPNRIRTIHAQMGIRPEQFVRFKYYFITHLMALQSPVELLFKGCHKIENMRPLILNDPTEFETYGKDEGISSITKLIYEKIFRDYTLSPFFENIDLATQALKFAKLFAQLIDHTESPNYTLETLRERHVKYALTHVQFANFKFYMSTTLQQCGIPYKHIRSLLRKMDTYKFAIINKHSLRDVVMKHGYHDFIETFVKQCQLEPVLYELVQRRGRQRFTQHCENMFYFFFRDNVKSITKDDIESVHCNKSIISEQVFNKFKEKAIGTISKLSKDPILLSDFDEDWDEIAPLILGKSKRSIIKSLGGQQLINVLSNTLEFEIQQRPDVFKVFEDNETPLLSNLKCTLNLLLYNLRFYKKTDIAVLHKKLDISEQVFYEFTQAIKVTLEDYPQLQWVNDLIISYKPYIVSNE